MKNVILGIISMVCATIETFIACSRINFSCGMDLMVYLLGTLMFVWGVTVPVIYSNHQLIKKDFRYQIVIRKQSYIRIILVQEIRIAIYSMIISIAYPVVVYLTCKVLGMEMCNWNSQTSMYYIYNGHTFKQRIGIILTYGLICIFLRCLVMFNILLLESWMYKNGIVGILIIFSICYFESIVGRRLICRLFIFDYYIWDDKKGLVWTVIQSVLYVLAFMIVFGTAVNRKEFAELE